MASYPKHWIFDLDGTLTESVHDFPAIARALGLPDTQPILESLVMLPEPQAVPIHRRLDEIELAIARRARPAPGAAALLGLLRRRGGRLGIVTRNTRITARATLAVSELDQHFLEEDIIGRQEATPKPDPGGIERLLESWGAPPEDAVMVGDYLFDLQAGRAAGVTTVYVDPTGGFPWRDHADTHVTSLVELAQQVLKVGSEAIPE
jgi:HAD superfamily hydrolase (TIGR01509 family)